MFEKGEISGEISWEASIVEKYWHADISKYTRGENGIRRDPGMLVSYSLSTDEGDLEMVMRSVFPMEHISGSLGSCWKTEELVWVVKELIHFGHAEFWNAG